MYFSAPIDGTDDALIVKARKLIKLFNESHRVQIESYIEEFLDEETNEVVTMMDMSLYCWIVVDFAEMLVDADQTFHQIFQACQTMERLFCYSMDFYDGLDE